ncbi:hypothetical protein AYI70_g3412 [Smittium culicis]|uniref:CCHC-type domain-containing protein n=1 Tax=Smittium culicis TaxID=133412 RepID=A0A1R1Y3M2_9FUNG|nr:hypothetical protein AYI70_g3412 [Smittium culicis]
MVIRKPIKRARSLFSDIVKGDDPEYANKAELTSTNVNSTSVIDKSKSDTQYLNQKTPKKIQIHKNQQKNGKLNKKITKILPKLDMTQYRAVSFKNLIFGGKKSCLKRFCVAGSDQKIGIDWSQFKGDVHEALDVVFNAIGDSIYTRYDDYRANVTYITLDNLEDATNLMSKTLNYDDQKIDLYQTVKIEEDIMTVNIPNFKEISITKMIELVTKQLKPLGEIKDISVLLRKNTIETELPLFLDHKDGRINIFYRGCKEACSYCKKDGHWKSECPTLKNITSKKNFMSDMAKSSLKFSLPEPTKIAVSTPPALIIKKYDPKTSTKTAEIPSSPIEKVSSGDDTESDGSNDDKDKPKSKMTTKFTINSDDFSDISVDSGMSIPMEIKKEFISPNLSPMNESDGYSPPSEHSLMAAKARMGIISGKSFNNYVSNVDNAPPGKNIAAIDPESIAEHQEISDIEF